MAYYQVFSACFPELDISPEAFALRMNLRGQTVLEHRENGQLAGFAMLEKDALRLLCVLPEFQGEGIGSFLLRRAEACARESGAETLTVGGTSPSRLLIGAPEQSVGFFVKHGYTAGESYEEMKGDLSSFRAEDYDLPVPDGVVFGWYRGDAAALREAIAAVDEDWPQYFGPDSPTFCAMANGEIASFCNVEIWENCLLSNGRNKVGAPGCVGTVPKFRRQGIGLKMVALACEELKKQGCDTCYIHYTGVGHWYARLGIKTFLTWRFCKKRL